jgi:hypothetical protein
MAQDILNPPRRLQARPNFSCDAARLGLAGPPG